MTIKLLCTVIYVLIGIICFVMAYKCMFAKEFLPFHQEAAGKSWNEIDKTIQKVIITILRISGLGFLIMFLLLTSLSIVNFFKDDPFIKMMIPIISIVFCTGLFIFNFLLFKDTNAKTPWKGSLIILIVLVICLIFSLF
jgi:hypothetical protein